MKNSLYKCNKRIGIFYSAAASTIWGFLPLYWKLLRKIPADELLAHRIIWSFVFVILVLTFTKKLRVFIKQFSDKKTILLISICSVLISINWFIYIWAVNSNHVIEASMGYYINPLISVLLGVIIFKEKLNFYQKVSLVFAATGVLFIIIEYGKIPWISIMLAISFASYGLFKKMVTIESIIGIALETLIMTPISLIYIIFKQINGLGYLSMINLQTMCLLLSSGIATVIPLLLFAKGAKRIELSVIGFLQYISPTISLILGIFLFHEEFTNYDIVSFGLIWIALIIFSLSNFFTVQNNHS
ncbi:EamA family transporter RarD [Clostridium drakei]|uniref:Protein RarD n=1 Tax=Clostridium drakei TaxID=332101 RepID=A0A2U8DLQ4_9CLOT|nr:EamA family transporter RarD [Clostridium drakei]AWI03498.1 protein RarD [Clostridium drakei]